MIPKIKILRVPIDNISANQAIQTVAQFIASGQPHQITTVNAEFIVLAQHNADFLKVLESADLSLADSTAVMWAAGRQGEKLIARIPGADFCLDLVARANTEGWSLYLVGGRGDTAKLAASNLKKRYPNLKIVGAEPGLTDTTDETAVTKLLERINTAKPDILLVAFGAPKQEFFIANYKKKLGVPVMIGVGGTLDFWAGTTRRAPKFMRQLGLEWLWRLMLQPSRINRIIRAVLIFPFLVLTQTKKSH